MLQKAIDEWPVSRMCTSSATRLCGNIRPRHYACSCAAATIKPGLLTLMLAKRHGPFFLGLCTLSLQLMLCMRSLLEDNATATAKCSKADIDPGTMQLTRTGVPHKKGTAALQLPELEKVPAKSCSRLLPCTFYELKLCGRAAAECHPSEPQRPCQYMQDKLQFFGSMPLCKQFRTSSVTLTASVRTAALDDTTTRQHICQQQLPKLS